ncbi:peptidase associated/transthyretin-like domain-containing protein [Natronospora cellulosivora (SeqCode)]
MKKKIVCLSILILLTLFFVACSTSEDPSNILLKEIEIEADQAFDLNNLSVSDEVELTAIGKDGNGNKMSIEPRWVIDNEFIGTFDSDKGQSVIFTVEAAGIGTITANEGSVEASISVNVSLPPEYDNTSTVTGYVTENRGGERLEGALVSDGINSTLSDENGFFSIEIPTGKTVDLIVSKEDYSTARIQSITLKEEQERNVVVPLRELFYSGYTNEPPVLSVIDVDEGAELIAGRELSAPLNVELNVLDNNKDIFSYWYIGESSQEAYFSYKDLSRENKIEIDVSPYPNEETTLNFIVYDTNDNLVIYSIPVVIQNESEAPTVEPEGLEFLGIKSVTKGENIGLCSISRDGSEMNRTMYVELNWDAVDHANGYRVYRRFEGEEYEVVAFITEREYFMDTSSELEAGREVHYKVEPYNQWSTGQALEGSVIPLPPINVYLNGPEDNAADVSLTPTLSWELEGASLLPEGAEIGFAISVECIISRNKFDYFTPDYEYTIKTDLLPNHTYTWDIISAKAYKEYISDEKVYSHAVSEAGTGNGSSNGVFKFTTVSVD